MNQLDVSMIKQGRGSDIAAPRCRRAREEVAMLPISLAPSNGSVPPFAGSTHG